MSLGHWWIIALILVVVLIIWGPGKLPDVGAGMGRAIRDFRHASNEVRDSVSVDTRAVEHPAPTSTAAPVAPAPVVPAPVAPAPVVPAPVTPHPGETAMSEGTAAGATGDEKRSG
ncbi:MAG: Sec-independent protein translocase subunit TatA/TatB [Candidatus Dormibacteria bacterium]